MDHETNDKIAHAAIDAGADVVMGHGPHYACAVQMYRGKPIFYGLGSFSFHTGHGGRAHGDWVGLLARLTFDDSTLVEVAFSMVRHNERNETYVCDPRQDKEASEQIARRCDKLGTTLTVSGNEMIVGRRRERSSRQCLSRMASSIWRARGASLSVQRARSVGARSASTACSSCRASW